jgi:hypothetical protein
MSIGRWWCGREDLGQDPLKDLIDQGEWTDGHFVMKLTNRRKEKARKCTRRRKGEQCPPWSTNRKVAENGD